MKRCKNCKYWKGGDLDKDGLGDCLKLSSQSNQNHISPEVSGVIAWPICGHDGPAYTFETKAWFGCIHFKSKIE